VAISEDCRSYSHDIAKGSLCWIAAVVHLRRDFFDDDSLPTFDWFHITQIFLLNVFVLLCPLGFRRSIYPNKVKCLLGRCILSGIRLLRVRELNASQITTALQVLSKENGIAESALVALWEEKWTE
jgi:hypothetical protein